MLVSTRAASLIAMLAIFGVAFCAAVCVGSPIPTASSKMPPCHRHKQAANCSHETVAVAPDVSDLHVAFDGVQIVLPEPLEASHGEWFAVAAFETGPPVSPPSVLRI